MRIDGLADTEVWVEKKTMAQIIGNSTTNNQGLLEIDSFGNSLISNIDSGDTPLYRLAEYNGDDSLMLYNPTTQYIQIANEGDFLNVDIDFERGTKYYLGSKILMSTSVNKNVFTVELNGLNPLKIYMDGTEIISYSISGNEITVLGTKRGVIDIFSQLTVYAYATTNITAPPDPTFIIEYEQYYLVWDKESFTDGSYLENIIGTPVNNFDSLSITQNVSKTLYRGGFKYATESRINSIDNSIDLNIFITSEEIDLTQYVGSDEFRMLLINPLMARVVLVNNCKLNNGIGLVYEKSKNTKKFTLNCGNYIDIQESTPSSYGMDKYGRYKYSSGSWVFNSHRLK